MGYDPYRKHREQPAPVRSGDTGAVGYDPYRKHRATAGDFVLVVTALVVAFSLVLWAVFG